MEHHNDEASTKPQSDPELVTEWAPGLWQLAVYLQQNILAPFKWALHQGHHVLGGDRAQYDEVVVCDDRCATDDAGGYRSLRASLDSSRRELARERSTPQEFST